MNISTPKAKLHSIYTVCREKKVIELQRSIVRELLGVYEQSFSYSAERSGFYLAIEYVFLSQTNVFHAKWRKNKQVRVR